nr:phosphoribosyl-AMP cyclohydrolase [Alcaligenes faecalis]
MSRRISVEQVEEGHELAPKFDEHGLIACITTDASNGEVLMLGYMNREALEKTIQTGQAHYWSRSRQMLWHKGASSGLVQTVEEMRIDDDQDAVWLRVRVAGSGASCHVGYYSCFYRQVPSIAKVRIWSLWSPPRPLIPKKCMGMCPIPLCCSVCFIQWSRLTVRTRKTAGQSD